MRNLPLKATVKHAKPNMK